MELAHGLKSISMSKKKISRKGAVKKADTWLSRYVRKSAANSQGYARCFTCGASHFWKELQCGHFQSRAKYTTRWMYDCDEGMVNVAVQCVRCNISNGGQQYAFGCRLDAIYGEGTAQKILEESNRLTKFTTEEISEIGNKYRIQFEAL